MLRSLLLALCVLCALAAAKNVLTPYGYHPEECVHYVAEDEVASFDDADQMFRSTFVVSSRRVCLVCVLPGGFI